MFKKIAYRRLNARQKEAFNFQKVSAVLADYGFITIWLSSDWNGADFIAQHCDGHTFLKVQLKGRLGFKKKYRDPDLYICFPDGGEWYLYPHNELRRKVLAKNKMRGTVAWEQKGVYHFPKIPEALCGLLEPYRLKAEEPRGLTSE